VATTTATNRRFVFLDATNGTVYGSMNGTAD
jgi:hypothetical protein